MSGKLKLRGDELSLHCDQGRVYDVDPTQPAPTNGKTTNGTQPAPSAQPDVGGPTTLLISLAESEDFEEDTHLLREVVRTLLEFEGADRVHLEISTANKRVPAGPAPDHHRILSRPAPTARRADRAEHRKDNLVVASHGKQLLRFGFALQLQQSCLLLQATTVAV